jgi:hypothetical protein
MNRYRISFPKVVVILICLGVLSLGLVGFVQLASRVRVLEDYLHFRDRWYRATITLHVLSEGAKSHRDGFLTLHLAQTNQIQRFPIGGHFKAPGKPVAAWFDKWSPRDEIVKFDELYLSPDSADGQLELVAKPRAGESIDMSINAHVLFQSYAK